MGTSGLERRSCFIGDTVDSAAREALAHRVVEGHKIVCRKLKDMEEDVIALWAEFDGLKSSPSLWSDRRAWS